MAKATTILVKRLAEDVLASLAKPFTEDVVDDVCLAIENNPIWMKEYENLATELRAWVVNNWIGRYVAKASGGNRGEPAKPRSRLLKSYSKLSIGAATT